MVGRRVKVDMFREGDRQTSVCQGSHQIFMPSPVHNLADVYDTCVDQIACFGVVDAKRLVLVQETEQLEHALAVGGDGKTVGGATACVRFVERPDGYYSFSPVLDDAKRAIADDIAPIRGYRRHVTSKFVQDSKL